MKYSPLIILGTMILIIGSCNHEVVDNTGYAIYKTRMDYFENIFVYMNEDKVVGKYGLTDVLNQVDNDTNCRIRARLVNGYIMSDPVLFDKTAFLDMTFKDYIKWCIKNNDEIMPNDSAKAHILDRNPFTEIYLEKSSAYRAFNINDTAEFNALILAGTLSTYFNKIK